MKTINYAITALISGALLIIACKKNEVAPQPSYQIDDTEVSDQSLSVEDNTSIDASTDDAMHDALGITQSSEGRAEFKYYNCDVTEVVMTTISGIKTIVYKYDGSVCNPGIKRQGTVTVTLIKGDNFIDQGAIYKIEFNGVGVIRNNKNTTLNGTHIVTNLTGGLPIGPTFTGTIQFKIKGNMVITYPSNKTLAWQVAKTITYTNNNGVFMTVNGDTTIDDKTNVIYWGRDRFDRDFITTISESLSFSSDCGWFRPTGGIRYSYVDKNGGDLTIREELAYGKDGNGCGNAYKVSVTKKKHTKDKVYNY